MKKYQYIKLIHWVLLISIIVYIITGFGITEHKFIEAITFGIISKPIAFQLHIFLIYPFIILLILHISLTINKKCNWKRKKNE